MALLQKMDYFGEKVVCVYPKNVGDGERTLCGNVCFVAGQGDEDDSFVVGKPYEGSVSEITCPGCLQIINFVRGLL